MGFLKNRELKKTVKEISKNFLAANRVLLAKHPELSRKRIYKEIVQSELRMTSEIADVFLRSITDVGGDLTLRNLAKFAANFVWNLVHPTTSLDAASFEKLEIIEEEVEKIIPSNL